MTRSAPATCIRRPVERRVEDAIDRPHGVGRRPTATSRRAPTTDTFGRPQGARDRAADETEPEEADAHGGEYRSRHVARPDTASAATGLDRQPPALAARPELPRRPTTTADPVRTPLDGPTLAQTAFEPARRPGIGRDGSPAAIRFVAHRPDAHPRGAPRIADSAARRAKGTPTRRRSRPAGRIAGRPTLNMATAGSDLRKSREGRLDALGRVLVILERARSGTARRPTGRSDRGRTG